jgi:hypothetical protein
MGAVSTSEKSVSFYQTTRRNIPENNHLHKALLLESQVIPRFRYPRFCILTILFQYQYPIRGHGRSCRAGPLSCARSFADSPRHFDFGDHKLRQLMVCHSENTRACYTFPVLRVFDTRVDQQERSPACNESRLYSVLLFCFLNPT